MAWNRAHAKKRIQAHLNTLPEFDQHITLAKHARAMKEARQLLDRAPVRRAFVVEAAHIYGQLLDFDSLVIERGGAETEQSHRTVLQFLDMHYRLWDSIVEDDEADRVDYHGARLHAVVAAPDGDSRRQIQRAVALAEKLTQASKRVAQVYGFPARIRFGIDQGKCLAMTTGRSHEKDTLFLGSPANHAAKKAGESDIEGIFLVDRAQAQIGDAALKKGLSSDFGIDRQFIEEGLRLNSFSKLDTAADALIAEGVHRPDFRFHRTTPPLSAVRFADLTPSKSVRMGMASIFADIDGFTAFVDKAVGNGSDAIKKAATAVHVIREELNDVLSEDLGGKRVRFIGDCIQGVVAQGEQKDDPRATVREAALCASAMQSSFILCQEAVGDIDDLGLAIGIEYGPVPLTRLGHPGQESIRCAAGRAVVASEQMQQTLEHTGVRLGPAAQRYSDGIMLKHFASSASLLEYDAAADLLGAVSSPAVAITREDRSARPYLQHGV